ncbi:unnamed protein product [Linum tenue]|uniref:Uncharacterized protein n=1 Tax=Linum tenue TaxID=586396 RepID=A0AAV0HBX0_9ROSI|nr:unnamed protein product [Linum tenue]
MEPLQPYTPCVLFSMYFHLLERRRTSFTATCILLADMIHTRSLMKSGLVDRWRTKGYLSMKTLLRLLFVTTQLTRHQHGPLFPNQGFLPVEALISEVEVWGLGGEAARSVQTSYKQREVDLKTFSNWEDSP